MPDPEHIRDLTDPCPSGHGRTVAEQQGPPPRHMRPETLRRQLWCTSAKAIRRPFSEPMYRRLEVASSAHIRPKMRSRLHIARLVFLQVTVVTTEPKLLPLFLPQLSRWHSTCCDYRRYASGLAEIPVDLTVKETMQEKMKVFSAILERTGMTSVFRRAIAGHSGLILAFHRVLPCRGTEPLL